ncbi:MAG: transglutaminase domain-containing protein [Oscillospiraceae bacterium]|nr:transglutaminase domain-containing protein [Oscillospiraceae bacterium]
MTKIIALLLAVAAAVALWFYPATSYADASKNILNPYAAAVVEQDGQLRARLSDANRQLYDVVKQGLLAHDDEITVRRIGYSEDDIWNVVYAINYDTPQMFWVDFRTLSFRDTSDGFAVIPTYFYTAEETAAKQTAYDDAVNTALRALDAKNYTDPIDKFLFLHDYLIENVRYDDTQAAGSIHTACGALVDKTAVCDGYARAFHDLCLRAGLECYYVEGTANTDGTDVGHAWNIVGADGTYYCVDVTWDDGDYEYGSDAPDYPVVSHSYFLVGADMLAATHKQDDRFEMPAGVDYGYFEKAGLSAASFSSIKNAVINALFVNITDKGRYYVEFEITDPEEFKKVVGSYDYAVDDLISAVNKKLDGTGKPLIDEYGKVSFSYQDGNGAILAMFSPEKN